MAEIDLQHDDVYLQNGTVDWVNPLSGERIAQEIETVTADFSFHAEETVLPGLLPRGAESIPYTVACARVLELTGVRTIYQPPSRVKFEGSVPEMAREAKRLLDQPVELEQELVDRILVRHPDRSLESAEHEARTMFRCAGHLIIDAAACERPLAVVVHRVMQSFMEADSADLLFHPGQQGPWHGSREAIAAIARARRARMLASEQAALGRAA